MAVEILTETPLLPSSTIGPYRHTDYLELPDDPRCELLYGRFYLMPPPVLLHQMIVLFLALRLNEMARAAGGLAVIAPMAVLLADHSTVEPDITYVSAERLGIAKRWIEGVPDLLVEVLSPSTARRDRGEKLRLYAESGVREYWIVDPEARQIEFLVASGGTAGRFEVALPDGHVYRSQILSEIVLDLADFWREVESRTPQG
ncbi:MAG TPA: Uma2 family endonuclease [Thermoanaerobaculia bacterium]|nr:Uma2 family endonuclease [Thermoanaerobaculia bacterium]